LEVPFDPKRVAVMDMAALDILEQLGLEERVVGASDTSLDYLEKYMEKEQVAALGTIKEADMEAVMASGPDVIFIGGRLAKSYDALSGIAPVVYLSIDTQLGTLESVRKNAGIIASIFGLEEQADQLLEGFEERLAALAGFSTDKTAIVGMVTSGGFNVLGNDGRCSLISREAGFENIGVDAEIDTSTHGNEASFEFVVEKEPDYVFVLDRDAAVGTEGAKLAQEIMENELIMGTEAYRNGNLIYLSNPAVWYTAEGGIRALDQMIGDLEFALLK
ncbi:MAG: ABC transporter substrate-binding protein, partial [Enterocloster sp.]|nr:ABC transporter substrate-binding protein [Enterocloster sp.]